MSQTPLKFCTTSTTTVVCSKCWMSCSKRLLSWIPNTSQSRLSNRFDTLCQYLKIDPYIVVKWDVQTVKPKQNWFFYVTLCLFGVFFLINKFSLFCDKQNKLNLTLMTHQTCSTRKEVSVFTSSLESWHMVWQITCLLFFFFVLPEIFLRN